MTERFDDQHDKLWDMEAKYWREHYQSRTYVEEGEPFDQYLPAYKFGYEAASRMGGTTWDEAEEILGREWQQRDDVSGSWDVMRHPVHDAWHRVTGEDPGIYRRGGGNPQG